MKIEFVFDIDTQDYLDLRSAVGWSSIDYDDAKAGLENSFIKISAFVDGQIAGGARLLWDKGYFAFLADVIVFPKFQGKGIGKAMVKKLLDKFEENIKEGHKVKIELVPAINKTGFYEGFGFKSKPAETHDRAMSLTIQK